MANVQIFPSCLQGKLLIPPSKSQTLRALVFAALASGTSRIQNPLDSPDTIAMIKALTSFGAHIEWDQGDLLVTGKPLEPSNRQIDCGNSGLVLRLIGALAALSPGKTHLFGDASIQHNRPITPLIEGLSQLGATVTSPLTISGPITHHLATIDGQDSQPVSGLLIASCFAPHPIELFVNNPGELPWVDLTLHWLDKFKIPYTRKGYTYYRTEGNATLPPFTYTVPADWSSCAFPLAAALLTKSQLTLSHLDFDDPQGDKKLVTILERMGAVFQRDGSSLTIYPTLTLKGLAIDINDCIDALPILSVIGCFAEGKTTLFNGAIARKKESDRISAIAKELKKMGATLKEHPDGLTLYPSSLQGALLDSHADHRIALALSVAAMAATTASTIQGIECIVKTYSSFYDDLKTVGAQIA